MTKPKYTKSEIERNIAAWLAALRSGKYKQVFGALADADGFCCLGVACEVLIDRGYDLRKIYDVCGIRYNNNGNELPALACKALGMLSSSGSFGEKNSLIRCNDISRNRFKTIANIIEKNKKKLFINLE